MYNFKRVKDFFSILKVNFSNAIMYFLPIAFLILLWQILIWIDTGLVIPSPAEVFDELITGLYIPIGKYTILGHLYWSLRRVLIAFVLGSSIGIFLGLYMGWNKWIEAIIKPLFEIFRPIPPIAWIPLAILWFGIDETSKIFICFIGVFVNVVVNTYDAVKKVDIVLINAGKTLGANDRQILWEIVVPSSLPEIFAGLQIGIGASWMTLLAAEMVRSNEGAGWIIIMGMENFKPSQILAGMIIIGIVGALLIMFIRTLERRICPWRKGLDL